MARLFLDTSAVLKLYIREPGTDRVRGLASDVNVSLFLSGLTRVEVRSALRRRERIGDISRAGVDTLLRRFEDDWRGNFLVQAVTDGVLSTAVDLVDRHGLRALDALQLGGCLTLARSVGTEELVWICSDPAANRAAGAEGLRVLDPAAAG